MCGIFGLLLNQSQEFPVKKYTQLLAHRGPDDQGWLVWNKSTGIHKGKHAHNPPGHVFLGHRRLSILDLSEKGWQPMSTPDNRYHMTYNGEIYNYQELRSELVALGHQFQSHSDTEVLLMGYVQWGKKILDKIEGMFAFAILDIQKRTLFLARDPFGIKPLFYHVWNKGFAFASEIQALLKLPHFTSQLNPQRTYDYLQSGFTDNLTDTLFSNIQHLPPAHYLDINLDAVYSVTPIQYWKVNAYQRDDLSFSQASKQLRELFLNSISLHLRSDVAVGAALSGGIDSSAIVCAIRYLKPDLDLHTFTYIADDPRLSEASWANIVGQYAKVTMHTIQPTADDLIKDLDDLILAQGEPFGSTSMYAQYKVFQLARDTGINVMLDGQGADELLGGYPGYQSARLASLIRQGHGLQATRFFKNSSQSPGRTWQKLGIGTVGHFTPSYLQAWAQYAIGFKKMPAWLNKNWFIEHAVSLRPYITGGYGPMYLRTRLSEDLTLGLLPLLRYEDRNSMTHSIESRVPFLNKPLVEFLNSLPEEYLIDMKGTSKSIFRAAMSGIVPEKILERRDKVGFVTPERQWLEKLTPWIEQTLSCAQHTPIFHHDALQKEWRSVKNGTRAFDTRIWRWLNFLRWLQLFEMSH